MRHPYPYTIGDAITLPHTHAHTYAHDDTITFTHTHGRRGDYTHDHPYSVARHDVPDAYDTVAYALTTSDNPTSADWARAYKLVDFIDARAAAAQAKPDPCPDHHPYTDAPEPDPVNITYPDRVSIAAAISDDADLDRCITDHELDRADIILGVLDARIAAAQAKPDVAEVASKSDRDTAAKIQHVAIAISVRHGPAIEPGFIAQIARTALAAADDFDRQANR